MAKRKHLVTSDPREFLSRFPTAKAEPEVRLPGWGEPPSVLTFVLNVLAGDRRIVRARLRLALENDFQIRTPAMDKAWGELRQDREYLDFAVAGMIEKMRYLADLWIDSGKSQADSQVDTGRDRNAEVVLPGRGTSLFQEMRVLFEQFQPTAGMRRDGTQGIVSKGEPHFTEYDLENWGLAHALRVFGQQWARFYFAELLNSRYARRIARCDHCREYFGYKRAQLGTVKYGVCCEKCDSADSVTRTERSRNRRLDTAARAWIEWESERRRIELWDWVRRRVNEAHGTAFGHRWFAQHLEEIKQRVEKLRREQAVSKGRHNVDFQAR